MIIILIVQEVYKFKRDEVTNNADVTNDNNAPSFKYKASLIATAADSPTFKIPDAKLYVPVVTLSTEDNEKLTKQLSQWFKKPAYWNKYKATDNKVVEVTDTNEEKHIRQFLIQVIKDLKDCLFSLMIMQ